MPSSDDVYTVLKPHFPGIPMDPSIDLIANHYLDSMSVVEILGLLESAFHVAVPDEFLDVDHFRTLSEMAATFSELEIKHGT